MISGTTNTNKSALGNWLAIVLIVWLLFFNGFSQIRALLESGALRNVAGTIQTGAGRVTSGGAPVATARPAAPIVPRASGGAAPAAQPAANPAAAEQAADLAYQATVQAVNAVQPAAAPPAQQNALPTAAIVYPTAIPVEQVTVVPIAYPQTYASNDPPTITPIPTLVYPTPLPVAMAAFTLSPDGKCVTVAARGGEYQQCQDWPYSAAEAASVADYLRTGLIPGTKVG